MIIRFFLTTKLHQTTAYAYALVADNVCAVF